MHRLTAVPPNSGTGTETLGAQQSLSKQHGPFCCCILLVCVVIVPLMLLDMLLFTFCFDFRCALSLMMMR
jgi:hypothetical protein